MPIALALAAICLTIALLVDTTPVVQILIYCVAMVWGAMLGASLFAYYTRRCTCTEENDE